MYRASRYSDRRERRSSADEAKELEHGRQSAPVEVVFPVREPASEEGQRRRGAARGADPTRMRRKED